MNYQNIKVIILCIAILGASPFSPLVLFFIINIYIFLVALAWIQILYTDKISNCNTCTLYLITLLGSNYSHCSITMLMANPSSTTPTHTPPVIKVNLIVLNENFLLRLCGVPSAWFLHFFEKAFNLNLTTLTFNLLYLS